MQEVLMWLLGVLGAAFTGVVTWFLSRRKNNAEADGSEILNVKSVVEIYQTAIDDLKKQLAEHQELADKLQETIDANNILIAHNNKLVEENSRLVEENTKLLKEIKRLEELHGNSR